VGLVCCSVESSENDDGIAGTLEMAWEMVFDQDFWLARMEQEDLIQQIFCEPDQVMSLLI